MGEGKNLSIVARTRVEMNRDRFKMFRVLHLSSHHSEQFDRRRTHDVLETFMSCVVPKKNGGIALRFQVRTWLMLLIRKIAVDTLPTYVRADCR